VSFPLPEVESHGCDLLWLVPVQQAVNIHHADQSQSSQHKPDKTKSVIGSSILNTHLADYGHKRHNVHCKEISIYVFPEKELRGLNPNFHIHVFVSDLYIPAIGPPFFLQQNRQTDRGKI
jgi:hypothetical protein